MHHQFIYVFKILIEVDKLSKEKTIEPKAFLFVLSE